MYSVQGAIRRSESMAQLRPTVLLVASAFLVLQLTELAAAQIGKALYYQAPFVPSACFGNDPNQFPADGFFAAGGDGSSANIWNNGQNCGKRFWVQCLGIGCYERGGISVKIVDRCPNGCYGGVAFRLSDAAYSAIADINYGIITVEYRRIGDEDAETFIAEVGHIGQ